MKDLNIFEEQLSECIKNNDMHKGLHDIDVMDSYLRSIYASDDIIIRYLRIIYQFFKYFNEINDQIKTLKFLANYYINFNSIQNAYRTIEEAIELAIEDDNTEEYIDLHQLLFSACFTDHDLDGALEISNMLEEFTDKYEIVLDDQFIMNTATIYLQKTNYKKAIELYLQLLDSSDTTLIFSCKLNLAICYRNIDQIDDSLILLKELESYDDIHIEQLIEYELVYAKSLIVNSQFKDSIEHIKNAINYIDDLLKCVIKLYYRRGIREKFVGRIEHLLVLIPTSEMNEGILYIISFTRSNQMSDWLHILEWCDSIYDSKIINSDDKLELKDHIYNIAANGAPFLYGMLEKYDDHHTHHDAWRWDNFSSFIDRLVINYTVSKPLFNLTTETAYNLLMEKRLKNSIIISMYSVNRTFLVIHSDKFERININEEILSSFVSSTVKYKLGELYSQGYAPEVEKTQSHLFDVFEESLNHIDKIDAEGLFFIPDKVDFIPILSVVFKHSSLINKMLNETFIIKITPILFPQNTSSNNYDKILGISDDESLELSKLEINNFKKNMNIEKLVYLPTTIESDSIELNKEKHTAFKNEMIDSDILHVTTHGLPIDNYADPIFASLTENHYINTGNIQSNFYNLNYKLVIINSCHSSSSLSRKQINLTDSNSELNQLKTFDTFSFPIILLLNRKSYNISSIWKTFDKFSFILSHNISKNLTENNNIEKSFSKAIATIINLDESNIHENLKGVSENEKLSILENIKGLEQMMKHPYSYATYQLYSLL